MTKADKEYFEVFLGGFLKEINGKFDVITNELGHIKEQTTKTNGRVTSLEKKPEHNALNCPWSNTINDLVDNQKASDAIKKWKGRAIAASGIIVGIIVGVLGTLITVFK